MYINQKTDKIQEELRAHNDLCDTINKLFRAINAQFPRLKCKLTKELIFEHFAGAHAANVNEFHRLVSRKDVEGNTELKEKAEEDGREMCIDEYLKVYRLRPFKPATIELLQTAYDIYSKNRIFQNWITVNEFNELEMEEGFEDHITSLHGTKLEEDEIPIWKKAQVLAASLSSFLKEQQSMMKSGEDVAKFLDELFDFEGTTVTPTRCVIPRLLAEKRQVLRWSTQELNSEKERRNWEAHHVDVKPEYIRKQEQQRQRFDHSKDVYPGVKF